jgi:hypothetical protein
MPTTNVIPLQRNSDPRLIELEFETPLISCVIRLTPDEARKTRDKITPWPTLATFFFEEAGAFVRLDLSPEGAELWRDEITLQLDSPIR